MKFPYIKTIALAAIATMTMTSCEDYLNKPTEDNYVADNYYQTDMQCLSGTSYLYSSPWSDFTRSFVKVGEILSGNYYTGSSPYMDFTLNSSDSDLGSMSMALWAAVGHCNTIYNYIDGASGPSQEAKNQTMGECLTWKAMAYFYLVRTFGEIPIVHDNTALLGSGTYNQLPKAYRSDVYEYIVMTLEKAVEILPETAMQAGRIDKATAQGLLAKVYLAKAGSTGALNADDLQKACEYARACIASPNHSLMPNYADQFRLKNNVNPECLLSWRWNSSNNQWTDQSFMQCDYSYLGFDETGSNWGAWSGMSIDLQEEFGIKLLEQTPDAWLNNRDSRLKATMMLPGFKYEYFWTDKGGYDFLRACYDQSYNPSAQVSEGKTSMTCPTAAMPVKHLYGNNADHIAGVGYAHANMANSLATHILRLSDVYLVLAEAKMLLGNPGAGTSAATADAEALAAINAVRERAGVSPLTEMTFADVWKERRLELAFEGDRWYDYARVSYYDSDFCVNDLMEQKRNVIWGLDGLCRTYYDSGEKDWIVDTSSMSYDDTTARPVVTVLLKADSQTGKNVFTLPFTTQDIVYNPNLASDVPAEHVDVRALYKY